MGPAMNLVDYFEVQLREKVLKGNPALFQLSKFGFVGVLNTIIGYGSFVILLNYTNYLAALNHISFDRSFSQLHLEQVLDF